MRIENGDANIGKLALKFTGGVEDIRSFDDYKLEFKVKQYGLENLPEIIPSFSAKDAAGRFAGSLSIDRSGGVTGYKYRVDTKFKKLNVEPFGTVSPLLTRINPKGIFTGWIKARGDNGELFNGTGELEGEGVGFKTLLKEPFRGLKGKATLKGNLFKFRNVNAMIGDSQGIVSGTIRLKQKLMLNLSVKADRLNLYDFVDGKEEKSKKINEPKPFFDINPAFHLHIKSRKGSLLFLDYADLTTSFSYYNHFFNFTDFSMDSNDGKWKGNATLNIKDGKNSFETNLSLADVNLKTFLPLLWEGTDKLTGKLDAQGKFSGEGLQWDKFRHTLNGEVEFAAKKGMLAEHPGASAIFTILNVVPIFEKRTKDQKGVGIPYDAITGTMKIKDGVGHTEDTRLEGSVVRMSAVGDVKFNDGDLDILLGVKPFTTIDKIISKIPIAGKILTGEEKSLITHYYKITGQFDDMETKSVPSESVGRTIFGILKRVLEAPGKALSFGSKKNGAAKPEKEKKAEQAE